MVTDLERLRRLAVHRRNDTRNFLRWLKYGRRWSKRRVMELQIQLTNRVWEQIDCTQCANCCASMQLQLTARDCAQVARAAGMTSAEFRREHTERHADGLWYLRKRPCLFLKQNRCTIYKDRPSRCRGFPYLHCHILDDIAGTLIQAEYCPLVFNVLEAMKAHPDLQRKTRRRRGEAESAAK
jgi:Fe-S-cluster containining protein